MARDVSINNNGNEFYQNFNIPQPKPPFQKRTLSDLEKAKRVYVPYSASELAKARSILAEKKLLVLWGAKGVGKYALSEALFHDLQQKKIITSSLFSLSTSTCIAKEVLDTFLCMDHKTRTGYYLEIDCPEPWDSLAGVYQDFSHLIFKKVYAIVAVHTPEQVFRKQLNAYSCHVLCPPRLEEITLKHLLDEVSLEDNETHRSVALPLIEASIGSAKTAGGAMGLVDQRLIQDFQQALHVALQTPIPPQKPPFDASSLEKPLALQLYALTLLNYIPVSLLESQTRSLLQACGVASPSSESLSPLDFTQWGIAEFMLPGVKEVHIGFTDFEWLTELEKRLWESLSDEQEMILGWLKKMAEGNDLKSCAYAADALKNLVRRGTPTAERILLEWAAGRQQKLREATALVWGMLWSEPKYRKSAERSMVAWSNSESTYERWTLLECLEGLFDEGYPTLENSELSFVLACLSTVWRRLDLTETTLNEKIALCLDAMIRRKHTAGALLHLKQWYQQSKGRGESHYVSLSRCNTLLAALMSFDEQESGCPRLLIEIEYPQNKMLLAEVLVIAFLCEESLESFQYTPLGALKDWIRMLGRENRYNSESDDKMKASVKALMVQILNHPQRPDVLKRMWKSHLKSIQSSYSEELQRILFP